LLKIEKGLKKVYKIFSALALKNGGQLFLRILKLFTGSQKGLPSLLKKPYGEGLKVGKFKSSMR